MSRGVQRCRLDNNHHEVRLALEAIGAKVQSLAAVGGGCPDLLVGYRGCNIVLEVKDGQKPPSARALTAAETDWQETWPGQVATVNTPEEAQVAVIEHAKRMGGFEADSLAAEGR